MEPQGRTRSSFFFCAIFPHYCGRKHDPGRARAHISRAPFYETPLILIPSASPEMAAAPGKGNSGAGEPITGAYLVIGSMHVTLWSEVWVHQRRNGAPFWVRKEPCNWHERKGVFVFHRKDTSALLAFPKLVNGQTGFVSCMHAIQCTSGEADFILRSGERGHFEW